VLVHVNIIRCIAERAGDGLVGRRRWAQQPFVPQRRVDGPRYREPRLATLTLSDFLLPPERVF